MSGIGIIRTLIALIVCLVPLVAQGGRIVVKGMVSDVNRKPIEFVTVRVAGSATGTYTGSDGRYSFSCDDADTVEVVFSCIGYEDVRRKLIDPHGTVTLNQLLRRKVKAVDEVEVEGIRKQTGQMSRISGAESYRLAADATGGSIESMLTTMGGAVSNNELTSRYNVRGGSYDENSVYINGMEIYRPQLVNSGQQEGLSVINPDMVASIEFSTGGFGAEYADKMSSALDIVYREPESVEGSVSLSLMGGSAAFGQSSGAFSQLHGVRYRRNSSLLSSMETKGEYDPHYFDYQTNMVLKMSSRLKMSVLGNISVNHYRFTPSDRTTSFGTQDNAKRFKVYFDGHEKDRFETYFGGVRVDYAASASTLLSMQLTGYLSDELVSCDISGEYWLDQAGVADQDGGSIGGELGIGRYMEHARDRLRTSVMAAGLRGETVLGRHNRLLYGLSVEHDRVMERAREWEMRDSAGYSIPDNEEVVRMIYTLSSRHDLSANRVSAFVSDAIKHQGYGGFWNVTAGVRASYHSVNKELIVSPRVSAGFIPDGCRDLALRVAAGIYYQSPFYKEMRMIEADNQGNSQVILNRDIKSPRSIHVIAGGDYVFRALDRPFRLSGEVYYKKMDRIIPYETDNLKVVYSGRNEASGYATGLDIRLFGQFVPGSDSWLSLSLMKSEEALRGVQVPGAVDCRYGVGVYITDYFPKLPRLKFSLRGVLNDGLPMTAPRVSRDEWYFRAPAYKRVDVGLMYGIVIDESGSGRRRAVKNMWVGVDVFNLFDVSNVSSYYWVTDVNNIQYAVPNYLTRRQISARLTMSF